MFVLSRYRFLKIEGHPFKRQSNRKEMVQFTGVYTNPVKNTTVCSQRRKMPFIVRHVKRTHSNKKSMVTLLLLNLLQSQ